MPDERVVKLARVLVQYSCPVRPGDLVAIYGMPPGEPLLRAVYREVLHAGGHPYLLVSLEGLDRIFYTEANSDQLNHVSRIAKMVYNEFDALISIRSQSNTRGLSQVDPTRQSDRAKAMTEVMEAFMRRGASGELRWVSTLYPTDAYAQDADMSLEEFEQYVFSTTYADTPDPVAEWRRIHDEQQRLVDWLAALPAAMGVCP